jgi:hypothetical protein
MSEQIKNIRLQFQCDVDWESMELVNGIKYCNHCQKNVYDFTDAKQHEFLMILAENNNNICGKFRHDQMTQNKTVTPGWKKWISAALVLVGINILNNKATAQDKQDSIKTKQPITNQNISFGIYGYDAKFPGGEKALKEFIEENMHYTAGMRNGRVLVSFVVNKDGTLSDFRILKGLDALNDNEALRILKLSPKWTPSIQVGKPLISSFTVSIVFDKAE